MYENIQLCVRDWDACKTPHCHGLCTTSICTFVLVQQVKPGVYSAKSLCNNLSFSLSLVCLFSLSLSLHARTHTHTHTHTDRAHAPTRSQVLIERDRERDKEIEREHKGAIERRRVMNWGWQRLAGGAREGRGL